MSYPIIQYHHIKYSIKGKQKLIIKHSNEDINQSIYQHIAICDPIMADSRTYIGPVYYNFQQLVIANADGSKKLPPLIIGKAQKPHTFRNQTSSQLGFYYRNNTKAWMTAMLYQEWLLDWDQKLQDEGRNVLLLQDNFLGHTISNTLTNI